MYTYEEYSYGLQPPGDFGTASDSAPHSGGSEYRSRCCWFVSLPCAPRTGPRTDPDRVRVKVATVQLVNVGSRSYMRVSGSKGRRNLPSSLPPSPLCPSCVSYPIALNFHTPCPSHGLHVRHPRLGFFTSLPHAGRGRLSRASLHLRRPDKGSPAFSKFRTRLCRCSRPPQEGVAKAG